MKRVCKERVMNSEPSDAAGDQVIDILISCDRMWQKRGFSSLFGAVFVIAYETGKVIDYTVLSKRCSGCKKWEGKDQTGRLGRGSSICQ